MKTLMLAFALFPILSQAALLDVRVAPEVSKYLKNLKVTLTYESTVKGFGCYVVGFSSEHYALFDQTTSLDATGGVVDAPASISRCHAKLRNVYFDGRQTDQVGQELGGAAAREMNRFTLIVQPDQGSASIPVGCSVQRRYVAGNDNLVGQLSCSHLNHSYFDPKVARATLTVKKL